MTETPTAYAGGFRAVADARRIPVAEALTVAADDAGMRDALMETRRRVLFARAAEARLTRQLGEIRAASLLHAEQWDGSGNPPPGWLPEKYRLSTVEHALLADLRDAQERRERLGDRQPMDLSWRELPS